MRRTHQVRNLSAAKAWYSENSSDVRFYTGNYFLCAHGVRINLGSLFLCQNYSNQIVIARKVTDVVYYMTFNAMYQKIFFSRDT